MRSSSGSLAIFRRDPLRPHRHGEYSGTASERLSAFRANGSKDKAALPQNWDDLKRTCGIFVPRNAPRLFDVSYTRRRQQGACHEQLRFSEIHIVYRKQYCLPEAILSVQLHFAAIIAALNFAFNIIIGACVFVLRTAWLPTRNGCPKVRKRRLSSWMAIRFR